MASDHSRRHSAQVEEVMSRIPAEVTDALDEAQLERLREAIAEARPWREHPVNIRVTLPLFARRMFITLIGGTDQRAPERRAQDRARHPLATGPNLVFMGVAVVGLYAIAGLIALLAAAAVRG